jgi:multidrug efflux system outer membrane protein
MKLVLLICVLLTGCAVKLPERGRAAPDFPVSWRSDGISTNAPMSAWWKQFGDESLNRLVSESLNRNHDLQIAAARLEQSRLRARMAGAELIPQVNASLEGSKQRNNFIGLPLPGGGGVLTSRSESYRFSLATSWELDLWGRIRAGQLAAVADSETSRAELAAARHSLAGQVVKAWLALTEARQQEAYALTNVSILETTVGQVRVRYELGIRPALDLRLAEANLALAGAVVEQWRAAKEQARRQLEVLLGRYPTGRLRARAALPGMLAKVPVGLPSDLLMRRPDLHAARTRLAAADARIAQARAELYPKISLTASGGTSSDELENLMNNSLLVWSFGANLAQPLFAGGRLRANVKLNEARALEEMMRYRGVVLNAFLEVETSLAKAGALKERESRLSAAGEVSRQALRLAEDRYARGLESFDTVLDSQRRVMEMESQRVAVRRQQLENRVNLHLALGGGFGKGARP